jgi:pimeloyl-ACP methyl ester carboxylesterase
VVIPALARTRRVLALSLPGHGESGPAAGGQAPGTDLAPFVAAFLSAVGAEAPLDLAGHSGTLKNLPRCTRRTLMTRTAS